MGRERDDRPNNERRNDGRIQFPVELEHDEPREVRHERAEPRQHAVVRAQDRQRHQNHRAGEVLRPVRDRPPALFDKRDREEQEREEDEQDKDKAQDHLGPEREVLNEVRAAHAVAPVA